MTHTTDDLRETTRAGAAELQKNFVNTYFALRMGLVVLATLLPLVLLAGGLYLHVRESPLPSLSDYYHAGVPVLRDWFVGTLCTVGVFLYAYRGFSPLENWSLNLAGVGAGLTALVPCACQEPARLGWLHVTSAVTFYLAMAFVCLRCAPETLKLSEDEHLKTRFARRYKVIGVMLLLSPVAAVLAAATLTDWHKTTFFIESFGVLIFALYWGVKSREFTHTSAEHLAATGEAVHVKGVGVVRVKHPVLPDGAFTRSSAK